MRVHKFTRVYASQADFWNRQQERAKRRTESQRIIQRRVLPLGRIIRRPPDLQVCLRDFLPDKTMHVHTDFRKAQRIGESDARR